MKHIENLINNVKSIDDVKNILRDIVDELIKNGKEMDYTIKNLDSDNVTEIDFGRTRFKNATKSNNKGLATQAWVIENFQPKA